MLFFDGGRGNFNEIQWRCMHCDNPPCIRGCPFEALSKQPEGKTVIDHSICFGGAKCRDVCPWGIPQRQAGVGMYLKLALRHPLWYERIKEKINKREGMNTS
jgi:Fe-S-cluster-containing dehydrogenase component